MSNEELGKGLDELRSALNIIDGEIALGQPPAEAVQALERAVDNVRTSVWAVLNADHSGDYQSFLGRIRVHRATETCEDVLADLYAETLPPDTPWLELFHATLRELSRMWKAANA